MSLFKSNNKNKNRVQEILDLLPQYPLESVERTNLLLEAQLCMGLEINKHAGWVDFNTAASVISGR